jgi:hypothetical protein
MTAVAVRMPARRDASRPADRGAARWIVQPHHPDWLRTPEPRPGRIEADRMRAALAWNTFRTLALVDPSRWLRQLHARLFGFDERYRAPESLDVRLWHAVPAPADGGAEADVVDVVLESDRAVWGLLTVFERDVIVTARDVQGPDPVLRTLRAVARLAGPRPAFVGVIASSEDTAPVAARLVRRYEAERLRGRLRHPRGGPDVLGVGLGTWGMLAALLEDAACAPAIDVPERFALRRCLRWLSACGVDSDDF